MTRITTGGAAKNLETKLEIAHNNWDLKYGRAEGKSATTLSINQTPDNVCVRINKIHEDMLRHEGFATAPKVHADSVNGRKTKLITLILKHSLRLTVVQHLQYNSNDNKTKRTQNLDFLRQQHWTLQESR